MVLTIDREMSLEDDYVDIKYRELTTPINQIIDICNKSGQTLLGEIGNKTYPIDISDILYVEWVDARSCIRTADKVYTCAQALSQIEQYLNEKGFIRVSKPYLVNIRKLKWVSSMLNMKLMVELTNGERIAVSRHYRNNLLQRIYETGKEAEK